MTSETVKSINVLFQLFNLPDFFLNFIHYILLTDVD